MSEPEPANYHRIAKAIDYLQAHFREQPSLDEVAAVVGLSPFHFQRLFSEWAGVSPKKFIQYLSVEYAKDLLKAQPPTLLDVAHEAGLSGSSRLHDLFISIEGMTPGEFKNGGESLCINYSFADSPFGEVMVASTPKGLCHLAFVEDRQRALLDLKTVFPKANYQQGMDAFQRDALFIFQQDWTQLHKIKLHLRGTAFQLKVWQSLLQIPLGAVGSYGAIAKQVGSPQASRAVGTAIGSNPIAFLIPCHRVIQASGKTGGYRWGATRKQAMLAWEAAQVSAQ